MLRQSDRWDSNIKKLYLELSLNVLKEKPDRDDLTVLNFTRHAKDSESECRDAWQV